MALKQDERALLQLLCERGQSYEDLAGLLGMSEDEVRAKARAALTELGGTDPDAEVGLTDYLLGQADPIGRADAVRFLQQDAEARELAATIATKIRAIAPNATLPAIPEPKTRRRKAAVSTGPGEPVAVPVKGAPAAADAAASSGRSSRQTRLIAGIAAGGVILIFAILAIAGVFSSDDSGDVAPEDAAAEQQREITPVDLSPVGGSGVAGTANFGLANDQLYIDLDLNGLDPKPSKDSVYVIWMMLNDNGGYPVSILQPDSQGSVQNRYAVPTPVAVAIGSNARSVRVSQSDQKALQGDIKDAVDAGAPIVPFSGDNLSEGNIPLAQGGATGDTATPGGDTGAGAGAGSGSGAG